MQFFKTSLLALLVFGVGTGIGLAWKSGWIPVEFGSANTGALTDDANDPDNFGAATANAESTAEDPELFAAQSEPPAEAVSDFRPARVANVEPDQPAELEWAREPAATPANPPARIPAEFVEEPRREFPRRPNRDIRLAAAEEPAAEARQPDGPASSIAAELRTIDEQIANEEFLAAHRSLSKLYWNHKEARNELLRRLDQTSRMIFYEPRPHLIEPYVIQPNDQLGVIAKKYQLTWEYLAKLNRTDPKRIQLNQKLKVLKGPFAAVVDLNEFALTVHLQGYYVRRYQVGIGKDGASPIGKFAVLNKVDNPQYTGPDGKVVSADDPSNPLGERWIDLGESYGIHGTIEPDSIGKAASRGCIRMRDKDVVEVYDFLVKGSEVVIRK